MSKYYIIPVFVPHLGCPHDCVFCNQRRITGLSTDVDGDDVEKIIEDHLSTFKEGATIEIAFFGGSFTAIEINKQNELLAVAKKYKDLGKIDYIRMSTRPDAIDEDILNNLERYGVDTIELGVQSLFEDVLYLSGRGHNVPQVYEAASLIKDHGINLGLQMMVGLPGDTRAKSLETAKKFIEMDPYCVRVYPTLVIRDTFMEKEYLQSKYIPLSLEEAVDICSDILIEYNKHGINVIRMGLQPTENIQMGKDVVAGPFHPSFRQLVESRIYRRLIEGELSKASVSGMNLNIKSSHKILSNIVGQKASNKKYFIENYHLKSLGFKGIEEEGIIYIEGENLSLKIYIDKSMKNL